MAGGRQLHIRYIRYTFEEVVWQVGDGSKLCMTHLLHTVYELFGAVTWFNILLHIVAHYYMPRQVGKCAKICMTHRAALRLVSEAWRKVRFERIAIHAQLQDVLAREKAPRSFLHRYTAVMQPLHSRYISVIFPSHVRSSPLHIATSPLPPLHPLFCVTSALHLPPMTVT